MQRQINCKLLAQERDQIWAAAVALYRRGEQWWLTSQEETRSQELNQPFRVEDPWMAHIREYVDALPNFGGVVRVYIKDILENCLQLDKGRQEKASQMRVAAILKRLSFTKKKDSKGYVCWSKELTPLTPTDTSLSEVSVPSNDLTSKVLDGLLTPTDTFLPTFDQNSLAVVERSEKANVADLSKEVSKCQCK